MRRVLVFFIVLVEFVVTFGLTAGELAWFQGLAESLMTLTARVDRPTGLSAPDATTGVRTPTFSTIIAATRCKVQATEPQPVAEQAGDHTAITWRGRVDVPVLAAEVRANDVVIITAVGDLDNPKLLNRRFRVTSPADKSYQSARRLPVEEVVA